LREISERVCSSRPLCELSRKEKEDIRNSIAYAIEEGPGSFSAYMINRTVCIS